MGSQPVSEAWIIRRVAERFGADSGTIAVGIGDDAAVLNGAGGNTQLITTDTLIEGVHFDLSYMTLADVGYKALTVSLSDINAMGGESIAALGTLGVPKGASEADIETLLNGIAAALRLCTDAGQHCALIGGDTVAAPQWMIGFTVLGKVAGKPLLRSGAQAGDIVWHSGELGLSGVGLEQLRIKAVGVAPARPSSMLPPPNAGRAGATPTVQAHTRPNPPLSLGPWLQSHNYATAAQDLSDSLSQVALQLAGASGVGIEFDLRSYAFAPEVTAFAHESGAASVATFLLAQAEDYQLLFTAPPSLTQAIAAAPMNCRPIGRVVAGDSSYIDERGESHQLKPVGFEHLSG